jgi:hypothetical protein
MERNFLTTIGTLNPVRIIGTHANAIITRTDTATEPIVGIEPILIVTADPTATKKLFENAPIQKLHHRQNPPRNRIKKERRNGESINVSIHFIPLRVQ